MPFPRRSYLIAIFSVYLSLNFLVAIHAQGGPPKPQPGTTASQTPPKEKEPDYSQEALVIEQLKTLYRFEKDGTGQHELTLRVKVQSEAALQKFGQLVFPYSSANEKLDIDFVRVKKPEGF